MASWQAKPKGSGYWLCTFNPMVFWTKTRFCREDIDFMRILWIFTIISWHLDLQLCVILTQESDIHKHKRIKF